MILYLALFSLLLCAVYAAIYLLGKRSFALAMAISWGAAWLATITSGTQLVSEQIAHDVTFLVAGTGFWMALAILSGRRALLGSLAAPLLFASIPLKAYFLETAGIDFGYALYGVAVSLIGVVMLMRPPMQVFSTLLGSVAVGGTMTAAYLSEEEVLLKVDRKSRVLVVAGATTLILHGMSLAIPFEPLSLSTATSLFFLGAAVKGVHLIFLIGLLVLWLQGVGELLRRESVFEEVATLAAIIEHDLRTPLSIMRKSLELLRRGKPNQENIVRQVGRLEDQLERIGAAIDILPSFSRAKRTAFRGDEPISLERVVNRSVGLVLSDTGEPFGRVHIHLPLQEAFVQADEGQLVNILSNLLRNSLEATDPDSQEPIKVVLEIEEIRQEVTVTINDNGKGIPLEILRRLGEAYVSNKTSDDRRRGLGIYVATRLSRFNGGRLEFDSDGATYSQARIAFPLVGAKPRTRELVVKSGIASGQAYSESGPCLFIDDDEEFLQTTTEWLESTINLKVITANSLEKASDILARREVRAVVMDQRLGADGQSTGEQWLLENLSKLKGARLVLLTGYPGAIKNHGRLADAGVEVLEKGRDEHRLQGILVEASKEDNPKS